MLTMKKTFLLIATSLLLFFSGYSQVPDLIINGYVFDQSTNALLPVEDQPVDILIDSTNFGFYYQNTVITDDQGYFADTIELTPPSVTGLVHISTYDSCLGIDQEIVLFFNPGLPPFTVEFVLCDTLQPDCEAFYYYYPVDSNAFSLTFQFTDASIGTPSEWLWDFGDGTTSTEQNPVHTFPEQGIYPVCLTITDTVNNCTNTFCMDVETMDPGPGGCDNFFIHHPTPNPNEIAFMGMVVPPPFFQVLSYDWDFGDGTTGTGQQITHIFPEDSVDSYTVCLTTTSILLNGDTCVATSCKDVLVNFPPGCSAMFIHYPVPDSNLAIQFEDWSFVGNGGSPDSWLWDFGDGNSSTMQDPMHVYADTGYYEVCLTITDSLDNCTDTYCETIFVGQAIPPPAPCFSFFFYDKVDTFTFTFYGEAYINGILATGNTLFEWDFDDGTTAAGQTVTHTFPDDSIGVYHVCITAYTIDSVTNDTCVSSFCDIVFVDGWPWNDCMSWFLYYPDTADLTINFEGYTQSIYPTTWSWEFGDGNTGSGQYITHAYDSAGVYPVTLITVDSSGCSWVSTMEVWVGDPSFDITGSVILDSNLMADAGIVRLLTTDSLYQDVIVLDSTTIQSDGSFTFDEVPLNFFMLYYVQAELSDSSAYFGQYMPTYHISSLTWQNAFPVLPIFSWPADIYMIPSNSMSPGPGSISGTVTSLGTRGQLEGVHVMLMNEDMEPYTYVVTGEDGTFDFNDIAYGSYVVHAEMLGIHTTQAFITLDEEKPASQVNFIVEGNQATLSVSEQPGMLLTGAGDPYPNPVTDNAWIELNAKESTDIEIRIYNQLGQIVYSESLRLQEGKQRVQIATGNLAPGIHLLHITTGTGDRITRRLAKTN